MPVTPDTRPDPYGTNDEWEAVGFKPPGWSADTSVASVRVIGPLTLWVDHEDGVKGTVRFEPSALTGAFAPLRDPAMFARVFVEGGAVRWPDDLDLAPCNINRHLAVFDEWVLR